jgi:hypothetical protein
VLLETYTFLPAAMPFIDLHSLTHSFFLQPFQAKQRYNARVTSGAVGFLAIRPKMESGDIDSVRAFFSSEDVGSWKDFSAAGYLLANAFRRTSQQAPDTLPSVKVSTVCMPVDKMQVNIFPRANVVNDFDLLSH